MKAGRASERSSIDAHAREPTTAAEIHGFVSPGYEAVREAFADNFSRRRQIGAACCVFHKGEKVVDLWGGVRNKVTGEPWEEGPMALVYSATKGLAAMTLALAHSRGWLDYDEAVCTYWPEFAENGKEKITVRQLLAHEVLRRSVDLERAVPSVSQIREAQIGYGYIPNRKSVVLGGDPRDVALRCALYSATNGN